MLKSSFRTAPLALAVAAAFALTATGAWAQSENGGHRSWDDYSDHARINTSISIHKHFFVFGGLLVYGVVNPGADAEALIQGDQVSTNNYVDNYFHSNDARVDDTVGNGATGNIGVNVAAGDNNIQSNELALAAQDATDVFGMATAQVMYDQLAFNNVVSNNPAANNAQVTNNVLNGAGGNVGLNVAAGDSNIQRNAASIALGNNNIAIATISTAQKNYGNNTENSGQITEWGTAQLTYGFEKTKNFSLDASFSKTYSFEGSGSGSKSGSGQKTLDHSETLVGSASSSGGVGQYNASVDGLSISGTASSNGETRGSNATVDQQSATSWDYSKQWEWQKSKNISASGSIQAASNLQLSDVCTQYVPVPLAITWSYNTATLGNNVLNNATGNIGVNVAAGTNNLQQNVMALAVTR